MSRYVEGHLRKDEKVLVEVKKNWLAIIGNIINMVLTVVIDVLILVIMKKQLGGRMDSRLTMVYGVVVFTLVMSLFMNGKQILDMLAMDLAITNKRVIGKVGLFSVDAIDFPIDKVDSISYKATFWGRIFKYYRVEINGSGNTKKVMNSVVNADELRNGLNEAVEMHAEEARKAQAEQMARAIAAAQAAGQPIDPSKLV